MVDVVNNAVTKIYENTSLTVTARIDRSDVESIEEVTFKFLKDGEQFEEKKVSITEGEEGGGYTTVSHVVKAPAVPADKGFYQLDYHYFYKVKNRDASTESLQNFPASRIQVFPRSAQLKATDKDGKAFPNFEFMVEQNGVLGEVCKTVAGDTPNAKGETIPAGSCEFNLGLFPGFRIVPCAPYQIAEEVVGSGRKREVKGSIGFRSVFVAPENGTIKQYVNLDGVNAGQSGSGDAVMVAVGVHPGDRDYLANIASPVVYFRATFGPGAGAVAKSARDDADHPTKILKPSKSDTSVTIEEKEAKKKYQGKVALSGGMGKFIVSLGLAGGDTCTVEISASEKLLTDPGIPPDATLQFENWRRVHYESMVPDLLRNRLDPTSSDFGSDVKRRFDELGRSLFIEFVHDKTHIFDAVAHADYGTLIPKRFLGSTDTPDDVAYVLGGRNWRKPPEQQAWGAAHPGKTLFIAWCDKLLKWRTDTADEKAGSKDLSGTLKSAVGSINVEEKFKGLFMPFSGFDGNEGVNGIHWTADISKGDAVCKCKPELTLAENRYEDAIATGLSVAIEPGEGLPARGAQVLFPRLPYPKLEVNDKTEPAEKDDGKLTLKDPKLGQELALEFALPKEPEKAGTQEDAAPQALPADVMVLDDEDDESQGEESGDPGSEGREQRSFSDWGEIPDVPKAEESRSGMPVPEPVITAGHATKLDDFFRKLFKDCKSKLAASADADKFSIEIHGGRGDARRVRRIVELRRAIDQSYRRTFNHDQHDFKKDLAAADTEQIQAFIEGLLAERVAIGRLKGKVTLRVACPKDAAHGVDDCFKAVKDKVKEIFDGKAKEFAFHPALDPEKDFAPREGDLAMAEITNVEKSSVKEWHFALPEASVEGTPGPGAFIGPEKTAEQCPVKFEVSVQPHEVSPGEADGKLIAWAVSEPNASKRLISLVLQGLAGTADKAAVAHGHGDKGKPGDCLKDADELCDKCVAHGRSRNLTQI